ncbi:MAG: hypothetical protein Ct9H300mP1_38780 [Planctomycetaceae bacterium]|nr:MAG: hypothetical protein Ct9H300mP1_38780 [Planctomycetaceae bacterium]
MGPPPPGTGRWLMDIQLGRPPLETTARAFGPRAITHILWRRADGLRSLEGFETLFSTPHHVVYPSRLLTRSESRDARVTAA